MRLETAAISELVRHADLALLIDLDGTLIPFADRAENARLDREGSALLRRVATTGVRVAVVSGRPQGLVDIVRVFVPGAWWVAEHGVWRRDLRGWECVAERSPDLDELGERLLLLAEATPGARVEWKTVSVCLHWRQVDPAERGPLFSVVDAVIEEWLETHPDHRRLEGVEMVEIRPRRPHKGDAVSWIRDSFASARLIAIGDDLTDEDMFAALGPDDLGIAVGNRSRPTRAEARLDDVGEVRSFLRWMTEARDDRDRFWAFPPSLRARAMAERTSFLVVSASVPMNAAGRADPVDLATALEPGIRERDGVWLGWSGEEREASLELCFEPPARPPRATFDLSPTERRLFHTGFCNRVLWPLLHGAAKRSSFDDDEWREYVACNEIYGQLASRLARPDATVWVHGYQLMLAGAALRRRGHRGPLGLFIHAPFPSPDAFGILPWAHELMRSLTAFDLIGFQAKQWLVNFLGSMRAVDGITVTDRRVHHADGVTQVGVFPVGIDPAPFLHRTANPSSREIERLVGSIGNRRLLLAVDRLDPSKGILQRLDAFARLLERRPHWRRRVVLLQVAVPSPHEVSEYVELRRQVEHQVGRINGEFGEADWVPVRYMCRAYDQEMLAHLYHAADVAVVTPLRDGMNLVAKEFVASQDAEDPGVLVLSRFTGAAEAMSDAILTNPFHRDGLADDLDRALTMSLEERQRRHRTLRSHVLSVTASGWASSYLDALTRAHPANGSDFGN